MHTLLHTFLLDFISHRINRTPPNIPCKPDVFTPFRYSGTMFSSPVHPFMSKNIGKMCGNMPLAWFPAESLKALFSHGRPGWGECCQLPGVPLDMYSDFRLTGSSLGFNFHPSPNLKNRNPHLGKDAVLQNFSFYHSRAVTHLPRHMVTPSGSPSSLTPGPQA